QAHRVAVGDVPAVVVGTCELLADAHGHRELLLELTHERSVRALPRFDLAAGELPPTCEPLGPDPARTEHPRGRVEVVDDDRRDDMCALHDRHSASPWSAVLAEAQPAGVDDGLGARRDAELAVDAAHLGLHRVAADEELARDIV